MDCGNFEEKILEVLNGEELPREVLSHINECKTCSDFYSYITSLGRELTQIEKLEPSRDFNAKVIEKLKREPVCFRAMAFINSLAVFASLFFVSFIVKRYFTEILVFSGKILKITEIFSEIFPYGFYAFALMSFLGVMLLIIFSGAFDVFLLSKLIKNGGRL